MNSYVIGNRIEIQASVTDDNGPVDPDQLTFHVKHPDGSVTAHSYGVSAVVRKETGEYALQVEAEQAGVYSYRVSSELPVKVAGEGQFSVTASNVI